MIRCAQHQTVWEMAEDGPFASILAKQGGGGVPSVGRLANYNMDPSVPESGFCSWRGGVASYHCRYHRREFNKTRAIHTTYGFKM